MVFGLSATLSDGFLIAKTSFSYVHILRSLPYLLLWNCLNLLVIGIATQQQPGTIDEDIINKPWRPLPAGRMQPTTARRLLSYTVLTVLGISFILNVANETALILALTWLYTDLGGSNQTFLIRNLLKSITISQLNKGSFHILTQQPTLTLSPNASWWLIITTAVIGTTIHIQDLLLHETTEIQTITTRKRKPSASSLLGGPIPARFSIAIPIAIWSVLCPAFWDLDYTIYILPVAIGLVVIFRLMFLRGGSDCESESEFELEGKEKGERETDYRTWWLWALWIGSIWVLPLLQDVRIAVQWVPGWGR